MIKTIFSLNTIKYPTSAFDISLGYLNVNKKRTSYMTETVESVTTHKFVEKAVWKDSTYDHFQR